MENIKGKVHQYGEEYNVVAYHNALLFERAWSLVGFERLLIEMYDDPKGVEAILDAITETQCEIAQHFVETGIHVARTGDDWGSQKGMLFSPKLWRRFIKPRLKMIWQIYQENGIPIIHHSCGDIQDIVGDLVEMGLDMLNPLQPEAMDLKELVKLYGSQLSFYGGISVQNVLPFGTAADILEAVKECVDTLGKYGGYMIAPSQSITSDVPTSNVNTLLDAMLSYCL